MVRLKRTTLSKSIDKHLLQRCEKGEQKAFHHMVHLATNKINQYQSLPTIRAKYIKTVANAGTSILYSAEWNTV